VQPNAVAKEISTVSANCKGIDPFRTLSFGRGRLYLRLPVTAVNLYFKEKR